MIRCILAICGLIAADQAAKLAKMNEN